MNGLTEVPEKHTLNPFASGVSFALAILAVLFVLPTDVPAQNPRLELGRRLKRFEMSWETAASPLRVSAVPFLQNAVRRFFTLNFKEAGRQLDRAWLELNTDKKSDRLTNYLVGAQLLVSPVCADTDTDSLEIELTSFYDDVGMRCERDAFDTLFDHAPDKLQVPGLQHISFELALNDGEQ